ncbi:MAG: hypothetical protein H0W50_01850 [Parachlamydiaceae bacterium]|nr:hypothetical protein [Parachlamydiaceae bacterium]
MANIVHFLKSGEYLFCLSDHTRCEESFVNSFNTAGGFDSYGINVGCQIHANEATDWVGIAAIQRFIDLSNIRIQLLLAFSGQ